MIEPRAGWVVVWIGAGLLVAAHANGAARAVAVSPGAPASAASNAVAGGCPTFSWSPAGSGAASELAVLEIGEDGDLESAQVVLRRQVAAGASSWTPGGSDCLAPERDYAWLVHAVDIDERAGSEWSSPLYFRVASAPSAEEVAAATSSGTRTKPRILTVGARRSPNRKARRTPAPGTGQDHAAKIASEGVVQQESGKDSHVAAQPAGWSHLRTSR